MLLGDDLRLWCSPMDAMTIIKLIAGVVLLVIVRNKRDGTKTAWST